MIARRNRQSGVTLVELVLTIMVISIGVIGILSVIDATVGRSADPVVQQQAIGIAESYLEEIILKSYSGGASTGRANFDDVDDYDNLTDSGVHDQLGNAVSGLSQYTVSVDIASPTALTGGVNVKQITVSVSGPGISNLSLVGYRADY